MTTTQLPKQLESVQPATEFLGVRHRWNTNEEIAALLIAFDKHEQWQNSEIKLRWLTFFSYMIKHVYWNGLSMFTGMV